MIIDEIRAYIPVGNYTGDKHVWDECEKIIMNAESPMSDRIESIRKIDEICGEQQTEYSEKDVIEFVEFVGLMS